MIIKSAAFLRQTAIVIAWTAISLGAVSAVSSHDHQLCDGFVEENDLQIPVGASFKGRLTGVSEAEFHQVLDRIETLYIPIVQSKGGKLVVNRKWADTTVNAYANRTGKTWYINMLGGLARHPAVTPDAFAMVACHELGHHIGGAPKIGGIFNRWATNEGGSDYFATLKCLRIYFDEESNVNWLQANAANIPETVVKQCSAKKKKDNDAVICMRSAMAGLSVAALFKDIRDEEVAASFDTPDTRVVSEMDNNHPATQCRLDTYWQGALCDRPVSEQLSDSNYRAGSCAQPGYTFGYRPLCWFKP